MMEKQLVLDKMAGFDNPHFKLTLCSHFGQEGLCFCERESDVSDFSKVILFRNLYTVVADRGYYIFVMTHGWVHFVHACEKIYRVYMPSSFFERDDSDDDRSEVIRIRDYTLTRFLDCRQYQDILLCYEQCFAAGRGDFYFRCTKSRFSFLDRSFMLDRIDGFCFDGSWLIVAVEGNELLFLPLDHMEKISTVVLS